MIEETVGADMGDEVGREKVCIRVGWRRAGEERREENCLDEGFVVN